MFFLKGRNICTPARIESWKTSQLSYKSAETISQTERTITPIPCPFFNAFYSNHRPKGDLGDPSLFSFLSYRKWGQRVYISCPESHSKFTSVSGLNSDLRTLPPEASPFFLFSPSHLPPPDPGFTYLAFSPIHPSWDSKHSMSPRKKWSI